MPALKKYDCLEYPESQPRRSPWVRSFCDLYHPSGPWGNNRFSNVPDITSLQRVRFKSYKIPAIYKALQKHEASDHPVHNEFFQALDKYFQQEEYVKGCMQAAREKAVAELRKANKHNKRRTRHSRTRMTPAAVATFAARLTPLPTTTETSTSTHDTRTNKKSSAEVDTDSEETPPASSSASSSRAQKKRAATSNHNEEGSPPKSRRLSFSSTTATTTRKEHHRQEDDDNNGNISWTCRFCTFVNGHANYLCCEMCQGNRFGRVKCQKSLGATSGGFYNDEEEGNITPSYESADDNDKETSQLEEEEVEQDEANAEDRALVMSSSKHDCHATRGDIVCGSKAAWHAAGDCIKSRNDDNEDDQQSTTFSIPTHPSSHEVDRNRAAANLIKPNKTISLDSQPDTNGMDEDDSDKQAAAAVSALTTGADVDKNRAADNVGEEKNDALEDKALDSKARNSADDKDGSQTALPASLTRPSHDAEEKSSTADLTEKNNETSEGKALDSKPDNAADAEVGKQAILPATPTKPSRSDRDEIKEKNADSHTAADSTIELKSTPAVVTPTKPRHGNGVDETQPYEEQENVAASKTSEDDEQRRRNSNDAAPSSTTTKAAPASLQRTAAAGQSEGGAVNEKEEVTTAPPALQLPGGAAMTVTNKVEEKETKTESTCGATKDIFRTMEAIKTKRELLAELFQKRGGSAGDESKDPLCQRIQKEIDQLDGAQLEMILGWDV